MKIRVRFAPSPTGPLHIGGLRTALFNYLIAKKSGGKFILRIEDTDSKRTVDGAEKHIIDSLEWLGLDFDEGPIRQSNRSKLYKKQVDKLLKQGNAYYAFDSQEDLDGAREAGGKDFKYNVKTRMGLNNSFTVSEQEIKKRVKVINDPAAIRNVSEKLFSTKYQKFMPDTIFSQNIDEIRKFFKKHKKVIVKPINSYSGNNIHLFTKFNLKFFQKFIKKHNHIMCQKYLPKIKEGDKRVFLINGKVRGAISRIPKKGSFLSNLSKGAKPINVKLTNKEMKISKLISKDLKKDKIFFAGIDFIDEQLNGDINVTSPTGLKTFYDLSKINLASTFWKELKA